jgi:hypothetical protein
MRSIVIRVHYYLSSLSLLLLRVLQPPLLLLLLFSDCIIEALSIKIIFPPSRLGLPWSVRVDQGGDELGPSGRHSLSHVVKPKGWDGSVSVFCRSGFFCT